MFRKIIITLLVGMLISVPVFSKPVLSVGGTHNGDASYFGFSFYNFKEDGLFLNTNYYSSSSNDWDSKFACLEIGYTGNRDVLPATLFAGFTY